ncbi:MAG: putative toxin-antitoxin system toxin component, PIN family [Chitinispirillales bacterium]|jgi:putative PIN family toxin of toxin-antitoxin system|nr:putative toxin-antitoxin system toxin component, PIN family [Chitinispirillales bacterium]
MRVVVDCNLLISAFGWGGKPHALMGRVVDGWDTLFVTDDILGELEETVEKPHLAAVKNRLMTVVSFIRKYSQTVVILPHHKTNVCRDKDDNMYLECADAANVDYIISGDKHLRELGEYKDIKIVNVSEYLEIVNS